MKKIISVLSVSFLLSATCLGQAISVNFAGDNGGGLSIFTSPSDVAGVVPVANWNGDETQGASGAIGGLVDDSGAETSASVSWSGPNNVWGGAGAATADERVVNGWLDDNGDGGIVSVTGIPFDSYDVYVYGSSDDGNAGRGWTTTINGTQLLSGGVFEAPISDPGGSYFFGFVDGASTENNPSFFKMSGVSGSDLSIAGARFNDGTTDFRGAISGFQIVAVPEPSAFALLALAGIALVGIRRR